MNPVLRSELPTLCERVGEVQRAIKATIYQVRDGKNKAKKRASILTPWCLVRHEGRGSTPRRVNKKLNDAHTLDAFFALHFAESTRA